MNDSRSAITASILLGLVMVASTLGLLNLLPTVLTAHTSLVPKDVMIATMVIIVTLCGLELILAGMVYDSQLEDNETASAPSIYGSHAAGSIIKFSDS